MATPPVKPVKSVKPPKPPTEVEIKRQQASAARAKRNEAGGELSHQERVAARGEEEVSKKNPMFRRTGTGSVADRLTRRDMPAKGKSAPRVADQIGKSDDFDGDAVKSYNREPVDRDKIHESKPHPEAQPRGGRDWDESKYRRHNKGSARGGKFA